MNREDAVIVESGDMSQNRKAKPDRITAMGRMISLVGKLLVLVRPPSFDTFSPDVCFEDGQSLSAWGLDAEILHLPGHSKGSVGVLLRDGDLFCGDLIYNFFKPELTWIDDLAAATASVDRLRRLNIRTVYPGHGKPFAWSEFVGRRP
jgi:hydroxyacylglutathione hydrolase